MIQRFLESARLHFVWAFDWEWAQLLFAFCLIYIVYNKWNENFQKKKKRSFESLEQCDWSDLLLIDYCLALLFDSNRRMINYDFKKRIDEKYWFLHLIVEYEMMRFFEKKRIIIDSRKKQFD